MFTISDKATTRTLGWATAIVVALATLVLTPPATANSYTPISGSGSAWASNAIDNWRSNVFRLGIKTNYASVGSVAGLNDFADGTADFAISDLPYGLAGSTPKPPSRKFSYAPIVAGGVTLMFNLKIDGTQVTNLKLDRATVAKIFTGVITEWNDPAIAKNNPSLTLPARKITPVVRGDASGSTAMFTAWLAAAKHSQWTCGPVAKFTDCAAYSASVQTSQMGSNGVAGFVAQLVHDGSIGYVENTYALQSGMPAAKILNGGGYFVGPEPTNMSVALWRSGGTVARSRTWSNNDRRSYPLSFASIAVVPTGDHAITSGEGKTVGAFLRYGMCHGQNTALNLGYAPLPINLVRRGLKTLAKIPGTPTSGYPLKKCDNPTMSKGKNTLKSAPYPDVCDKRTAAPDCVYGQRTAPHRP